MRKIVRPTPRGATHLYGTYRIASPITTHYRQALCGEINCPAYVNGWWYYREQLSEGTFYELTHAGKRYRLCEINGRPAIYFEPGQLCFHVGKHVVSLERPEFYYYGRGDYRSFTTRRNRARQMNSGEWVDRFANHMDKINQLVDRG